MYEKLSIVNKIAAILIVLVISGFIGSLLGDRLDTYTKTKHSDTANTDKNKLNY